MTPPTKDTHPHWAYKIRTNFTYDFDDTDTQYDDACLTPWCLFLFDAPSTSVPSTAEPALDLRKAVTDEAGMSYAQRYALSGFLTLQSAVDSFILAQSNASLPDGGVSIALMPTPATASDNFQDVISEVLAMLYMLAFLHPVSRLIRALVLDKERGHRELLRIHGVSRGASALAWTAVASAQFLLVAAAAALATADTVFKYSDTGLVFAYFAVFGLSVVQLCALVAVFFDRAKTAATLGPLIFFSSFFPYYAGAQSPALRAPLSVFSAAAFSFGADVIAELEGVQVGLRWANAASGDYAFTDCLLWMALDALLYGALAWYLDRVLPSALGTREHPLFLLRRRRRAVTTTTGGGVHIRGLRKVYDGGKVAVHGLDLDLHEGHITALLGHNGAGKTTTIGMLTGLVPRSAGSIAGADTVSLCPQHDVLYPELTVFEHLRLFAACKGQGDPAQLAKDVGLAEQLHQPAQTLSGGQRRKLCVAIALIGDPRVVILDEPTAAMDPHSRRATWRLLQRRKAGRVILLVTHFLDEADLLGDRVAIMAGGRLRCVGSPLFLKTHFGVGYTLTATGAGDPEALWPRVRAAAPEGAQRVSAAGGELVVRLPLGAALQPLFAALDAANVAYGISVTTLEEVFLRLVSASGSSSSVGLASDREVLADPVPLDELEQALADPQHILEKPPPTPAPTTAKPRPTIALLRKRARYARRDLKAFLLQLVLPVVFVSLGLLLLLVTPDRALPALRLTADALELNPDAPRAQRNVVAVHGAPELAAALAADDQVSAVEQVHDNQEDHFQGCAAGPEHLVDLSNWLLDARGDMAGSRYGAFAQRDNHTTVLVNASLTHAAPFFLSRLASAALPAGESIEVTSHPLPRTWLQGKQEAQLSGFTASLIAAIGFAFVPASFVIFVVRERELGAKHLQLMSGVSLPAYWASTFAWDCLSYVATAASALALFFAFGIDEFVASDALPATLALLLLYGPATAGLSYIGSFAFRSASTAQSVTLLFSFVSGLTLSIASFVLGLLETTRKANYRLKFFYRLFPAFCLADGLTQLSMCVDGTDCPRVSARHGYQFQDSQAPTHWDTTGYNLAYLAVEGVVYVLVAVLMDHYSLRLRLRRSTQDPPPQTTDQPLDISHLSKSYGDKKAVDDLSFSVRRGEVFGFLGVNGAGKSTTLAILSGERAQTSGTARVAGFDTLSQQHKCRQFVGYCPQRDALLPLLTVREHLQLFASVKGLPRAAVRDKLAELWLTEFADVPVKGLSGGNKRKLSVAVATLGAPAVVFLDEPSAGVDPAARRRLWDVVAALAARGTAVVLTTHSMEEAEALCGRIGIMVGGRLRCLGSPQQLKTELGEGRLELHASAPPAVLDALPYAPLERPTPTSARFRLDGMSLVEAFAAVEAIDGIEQFSITQPSIEAIFLSLASSGGGGGSGGGWGV